MNDEALKIAEYPPETRVLLVEDNDADVRMCREILAADESVRWRLEVAESLTAAESMPALNHSDAFLLDLGLPESVGVETLRRFRRIAPDKPIVVMTGLDDDAAGIESLKEGAQDFLVKGRRESETLSRSLRYAIERHALRRQIEQDRIEREQELERERVQEERSMRRLASTSGVTARLYGRYPLSESAPLVFDDIADEYRRRLLEALEQQVKRVEHDVSGGLRDIADRLGRLGASPRDVVEVHMRALKAAGIGSPIIKRRAIAEEGRFRALELMGHLVSYYRRYAMGMDLGTTTGGGPVETEGANGGSEGS